MASASEGDTPIFPSVDPVLGLRKALEKDKARRYASAAALAEDIRRYLADEPPMPLADIPKKRKAKRPFKPQKS